MEKLTESQERVLEALKKLMAKNGYPPTVREVGKEANLKSPATIHFHLNKLEEKGYIKKGNNKNRTIELLVPNEYSKEKKYIIEVPVLDKDTIDISIEKIETPIEYMTIPANLIDNKKNVFIIRALGDSMIKVGIYNGDILIVERKNTASNGDFVVYRNDDKEISIKTFYKEENYIRLQPENDSMEPIFLEKVTVIGKVIGLYRKI